MSVFAIPVLQGVAAAIVAATLTTGGLYVRHSKQFEDGLATGIAERIKSGSAEHQRVANALMLRKDIRAIDLTKLNKEDLERLAKDTNGAFIHASGNCALLSRTLLLNLISGENAFSVCNTRPVYEGIESGVVDEMLFGKPLQRIPHKISTADAVESAILNRYKETGQKFYVIEIDGYKVSCFGEGGHTLNAVVLVNEEGRPYVQFVDPWKTSRYTPTKEELAKKYNGARFEVFTHYAAVVPLDSSVKE